MHLNYSNLLIFGRQNVYLVYMQSLYPSYVRAFEKCSQAALENRAFFKTITPFALIISEKANELIRRASLNPQIDLPKLQKEIFELGSEYIHQFADIVRKKDKVVDSAWFLRTCDPKSISKAITLILETRSM